MSKKVWASWMGRALCGLLVVTLACSKSTDLGGGNGGGGGGGTTPDLGGTWTLRTSGTGADLYSVAASPDQFAAVGDSGILLRSSDGVSWQKTYTGASVLHQVIWTGDRFVAIGRQTGGNGSAWYVTWVPGSALTQGVIVSNGVSAGGVTRTQYGQLLACASYNLLTSTDATNWTMTPIVPNGASLAKVWGTPLGTFGSGMWKGYGKTFRLIGSTVDTNSTIPWVNNAMVWTGSQIFTSSHTSTTDAVTWVQRPAPPLSIHGLLWQNSLIIAVGVSGKVGWSTDGTTWESTSVGITNTLLGIAYANQRYVSVGVGGVILTRP